MSPKYPGSISTTTANNVILNGVKASHSTYHTYLLQTEPHLQHNPFPPELTLLPSVSFPPEITEHMKCVPNIIFATPETVPVVIR